MLQTTSDIGMGGSSIKSVMDPQHLIVFVYRYILNSPLLMVFSVISTSGGEGYYYRHFCMKYFLKDGMLLQFTFLCQ